MRSRVWCHLIYDCNAEAKSERKNLWLGFSFKREASVRCFCRKAVLVSLFYCILRENPDTSCLVSSVLEPPNWVSRLKIRIDKQKKHWRVSQIILVPFDFRPRFGPRRPSLMPTIYVAYMPRRGPKFTREFVRSLFGRMTEESFPRILVGGKRERTIRGLIVDTGNMRRD